MLPRSKATVRRDPYQLLNSWYGEIRETARPGSSCLNTHSGLRIAGRGGFVYVQATASFRVPKQRPLTASLLRRPGINKPLGHRTAASSLEKSAPAREISTSGCSKLAAAIQFRSRRDPAKTGNPTGRRMGSTSHIVPRMPNGGLFVVPVLGGEGLGRKIASFGYYPRWLPNTVSQILFRTHFANLFCCRCFYLVVL